MNFEVEIASEVAYGLQAVTLKQVSFDIAFEWLSCQILRVFK